MSGSDGARGADLWEVFSVVPDHRRAEGKRYPLAGLLMIALAAMLAGRSDQLGIVRWGRKLSREALAELGILRGRVPAPSVWSELFRALDVGALERLLGAWVKGAGVAGHVAIDGKRLRGSAVGDVPGVHLLAAFSERLQGVIGQLRVAPEANEITAALTLLKTLPIEGAIISGDAIFAQTDLCRLIVERGGDYFFTVKSNQPTLEADIALAFRPDSPSAEWAPAPDVARVETVEKGHGRIEIRTYAASRCVDWIRSERSYPGAPGFASIKTLVQVHRRTEHADRCTFDTHHYISSAALDIARLAQAVRGHWGGGEHALAVGRGVRG
jgi:predicted transposase YbfD/YdcC